MNAEMAGGLIPFRVDEKSDSEQSSGCGDHDKNENQETAEILLLCYLPYFAPRCRQNCHPIKRKDNDSDCVPPSDGCTPDRKITPCGKEHRRTGGQSKNEAMSRVLSRNKSNNAHVSGWLSLGRTPRYPAAPIRDAKYAAHRGGQSFF